MYLIVYESGEKAFAFDSSLTSKLDVAKNYKEFDITSLGILVNEESKSVIFKIAKNTDGSYAILASNGNYIYHTGTKNTLSEEKKVNNSKHTITFDANGNVILKMSSADYSVRFNSADSDMRFRYYKSGQQSISLYKYSTSTSEPSTSEPSTSHKINYANLPEGTTNSNPTSYTEGETITLVDPVLAGYTFDGWFDNAECTGTKITEISASYTTDITLYAKFTKDSSAKVTKWKLVTDASSLKVGDEIVIASNSKGAIAGSLSGKFLTVVEATFNSGKSEITSSIASESIFVLGGEVDKWTLTNSNGKMLGASAAKSLAEAKGTTTWKITIANNNATISSTNNSYGRILHNVSSTRFLNYTSSTNANMLLPQIYKKVVE